MGEVLKLDPSCPDILSNPRFAKLSGSVFDMIDLSVGFLGPDLDPLADQLLDLGERHVRYGVHSSHLTAMGKAIVYTMQELLGDKFREADVKAWVKVYKFMISHMGKGLTRSQ